MHLVAGHITKYLKKCPNKTWQMLRCGCLHVLTSYILESKLIIQGMVAAMLIDEEYYRNYALRQAIATVAAEVESYSTLSPQFSARANKSPPGGRANCQQSSTGPGSVHEPPQHGLQLHS